MKQYCKTFSKWDNGDYDVSSQLNIYLKKHPHLTVSKISYQRPDPRMCHEFLTVVFDVNN